MGDQKRGYPEQIEDALERSLRHEVWLRITTLAAFRADCVSGAL